MQVFEYQLIFPEGSRYYDCRMVVSGKNKTLANVREITKIKQAEAALRRLNQELEDRVHERTAKLEAANKELESFAYSVSHDLRAPLRAIDGFSLALAEDYGDQLNVVALDYLQRVRKGAQRMGLLIDDMLQLSRVKSQEVDLGEIAETVLQEFRAGEPERRVELTLGRDMRVQGDSRLLRVMLDNLLGNAWKFTAREAVSQIIFKQKTDQPGTFYMSDNGVGFDMRHADKLFGAFQRLHRVTDFPGTGVGLATVQRIINRHGGRVWGEAQEGKGATFYFCIETAGAPPAKP
jgi:light-regulated signal transduction histidine kinase (bacteriophytochrome)